MEERPPLQRQVDTTGKEARLATAGVAAKLEPLRARLAVIIARGNRKPSLADRRLLLSETKDLSNALEAAREELAIVLRNKPEKVLRHSRVTDLDKSLSTLERELQIALTLLSAGS